MNIILYGAGEALSGVVKFIEKIGNYYVQEIWDNDSRKWGQVCRVGHQECKVCKPRFLQENEIVIVTSALYYDEIREQLQNQLHITSDRIKPRNYVLNDILNELVKRYNKSIDWDSEIAESLQSIHNNGLEVYNSRNLRVFDQAKDIEIELDEESGLFYGLWHGRRLYLKRSIHDKKRACTYMREIIKEQSPASPHCYMHERYCVQQGDIVVDAGAAEGFFALDQVDIAERIFIIEGEKEWLEALEWTFRPYMHKVVIIPKWLGSRDTEDSTTLDSINEVAKISFVKMDIEGAELDAINGAKKTFVRNKDMTVLACVYHRSEDAEKIGNTFLKWSYRVEYTKGYMFFPYGQDIKPELRHGLLLAKKNRGADVLIWGTGKYADVVYHCLNRDYVRIIGFIDNNKEKQMGRRNDTIVLSPQQILELNYDYIVISAKLYEKEILSQCKRMGINTERVISFWGKTENISIIDNNLKQLFLLSLENKNYKLRLENSKYELGLVDTPKIKTAEEVLNKIRNEHSSLCRFGDGEFEMMLGNVRPWFQMPDVRLAQRLKDVFFDISDEILIAIADNFGNLDKYEEDAADGIREYLSGDKREQLQPIIESRLEFYDAYVTRPYLIYRDKQKANEIFESWKAVWSGRDVVLVEGILSRVGVGNDLFENTKSIRRILCPSSNAFDRYDDILNNIKQTIQKEDLILISLGPVATVLAYDIAKEGMQAIDIGQLDNEYEWFLRGSKKRERIEGKMVAEMGQGQVISDCTDGNYKSQIIAIID